LIQNIFVAAERTLSQLFDRAFLKVFILGLITTFVAIIISYFVAHELAYRYGMLEFAEDSSWGFVNVMIGWVNGSIEWLFGGWLVNFIFFLVVGFLFAPLSTIFTSIYLDDVVDAVEDKFYKDQKAGKRLGIMPLLWIAGGLAFWILFLNILVIPLYIMFFWVPFLPFGIFIFLNSYLLGWGYYEMVAVRHLGRKQAARHRRAIRGEVLLGGLLITGLYSVPFVNMFAPIIGAAVLSHLFHLTMQERSL
jgi:CysZ protein